METYSNQMNQTWCKVESNEVSWRTIVLGLIPAGRSLVAYLLAIGRSWLYWLGHRSGRAYVTGLAASKRAIVWLDASICTRQ